jgi:T-complex protein 10 C-terminus
VSTVDGDDVQIQDDAAQEWQADGAQARGQPSSSTKLASQTGSTQTAASAQRSLPQVRDSCVDACTRVTEHADGKVERVFADGRREVCFANGTAKHIFPSGLVAVQFANGDMKKNMPSGDVEYFYKEVETWHITLKSGIEVCKLACADFSPNDAHLSPIWQLHFCVY